MPNPFRHIDDAIIYHFTTFVWWTDVRFDKDNVWWARWTYLYVPPMTILLTLFVEDRDMVLTCLNATIVYLIGKLAMLTRFSENNKLIKDARSSPNPNKYNPGILFLKCFFAGVFIILILFGKIVLAFLAIGFIVSDFFLCTDNIPPAEKRKRKEKNEMKDMVPASTM
jgi:hypothetical protein